MLLKLSKAGSNRRQGQLLARLINALRGLLCCVFVEATGECSKEDILAKGWRRAGEAIERDSFNRTQVYRVNI